MRRLFLVRHAQSEFNEKGIFQGKLDSDLTPLGFVQARLLASSLSKEKIDRIISSPQRRAYKTALTVSDLLGVPLEVDERIREMSFGELEGKEFIAVAQEYGERIRRWLKNPIKNPLPTQESMKEFIERIESFLRDIESSKEESVCVVAHGGSLQALLCLSTGIGVENMWSLHMDNTGLTLLERDGDSFRLVYLNKTCHLKDLKA